MIKRISLVVTAAWIGLATSSALANPLGVVTPDRWMPHEKVGVLDHVTMRIHWHDDIESLRETAAQHEVSAVDLHGFSILRRNSETGEFVCDVYAVRMRGALVDNDRTMT